MVYSDNKGRKTFIIILTLLIIIGAGSYYFAGDQIRDFFKNNTFLSQITFTFQGDTGKDSSASSSKTQTTTVQTQPSTYADYVDFMNELEAILTNHSGTPNNHKSVKRAQTTKSLLEAFVKQL